MALPELLNAGTCIDLAYVDGVHTFDYTLIDFWYLDKMVSVCGVIGFNDCNFPAVHKVIKFILTHRKYEEVDVGLERECVNYSRLRGLVRRLKQQPVGTFYRMSQDRYFRKIENWERRWDFFAEF